MASAMQQRIGSQCDFSRWPARNRAATLSEGAIPNLLIWRANEKEESQEAQTPAVRAAPNSDRACNAAREYKKKESRICVNAVAADGPHFHVKMMRARMFPGDCLLAAMAAANREIWTCTSRNTIYEAARSFCLEVF